MNVAGNGKNKIERIEKMKISRGKTTVAGIEFEVFSDFVLRGMIAVNTITGEERIIKRNGYLGNDLSIRKAVAASFKLSSFRTK